LRMKKMRKINDYFNKQMEAHGPSLPRHLLESFTREAEVMSELGVKCPEDQSLYFALSQHVPVILKEIAAGNFEKQVANCICDVFQKRKELPLNNLREWFYSVSKVGDKLGIPLNSGAKQLLISGPTLQTKKEMMDKTAYPQGSIGKYVPPPYNVYKWVEASQSLHILTTKIGFNDAFAQVTQAWKNDEIESFQYWLRFYGSGEEVKYKLAQAQIPINQLRSSLPPSTIYPPHIQSQQAAPAPSCVIEHTPNARPMSPVQVQSLRVKIENQRQKIISRLNAAERLLTTPEGQIFCGNSLGECLKILHELKLKIQTAQKISVSSTLFEDFIYRTANLLKASGRPKLGNFFVKVAQAQIPASPPDAAPPSDPAATPAGPGMDATFPPMEGDMGLEGEGAFADEEPMDKAPSESEEESKSDVASNTKGANKEFFANLESGPDMSLLDDEDTPRKRHKKADIEVTAQALLPGQTQNVPTPVPARAPLAAPAPPPDIQVSAPAEEVVVTETAPLPGEEEIVVTETPPGEVDEALEAVLSSVTIEDVLERLEEVEGEFKRRDTARKLSIIDLMMNRLGIVGFFPSLGESMGKALEANQYISTRLEDITSRIRAAVEETQQTGHQPKVLTPEAKALRKEFDRQDDIANLRREKRRAKEDKKLLGPEAGPTMEQLQSELAQPLNVEAPPAPPINPGEHVATVPMTAAQIAPPPAPVPGA